MSKWLKAAETALKGLYKSTKIPYEFECWDEKERGKLPDTYIVYFLVSEPSALSLDGEEKSSVPKVQFSLYFRDKKVVQTLPDKIIAAVTAAGFRRSNTGRIPKSNNTGHYGWRSDFVFYERR